jgi:hypothetical protein
MFFLPKGDYRVDDQWHVVGLQGTDSNTVVVDKAFIPAHRVFWLEWSERTGQAPGQKLNPSPLFRLPFVPTLGLALVPFNVVCPGTTMPESEEEVGETSMWAGTFGKGWNTPEMRERIARASPLRRIGRPEDVANAVVFLASDAASFITGQTLSVSGGYTMM